MAKVLIASLGGSPVVVPIMYDLLKHPMGIQIDEVRILTPKDAMVQTSYRLVEEALQAECLLEKIALDNVNTETDCLQVLQVLVHELEMQQQKQNEVYLSLAGARKSLSALMACVVSLFPNVKVYDVIDPEEQFPSIGEMMDYSPDRRKRVMRPKGDVLANLKLVQIPNRGGRPPQKEEIPGKEHVLLVPLGAYPMIATQLYTLLTEKGMSIQEIVLFYPELRRVSYDGNNLLDRVVQEEKRRTGKNIKLRRVAIPNMHDIDSLEACNDYQQKLEEEIQHIREDGYEVVLGVGGGRQGMTAMTIFAAQNMGVSRIYLTLIADEKLSEKIEEETTISALNNPSKMTKSERNGKLFLRSYDRSQFHLFRLPISVSDKL